jgi:FKBP-type peptidyl-prolyl cis-trans isomerase 2
MYIKEGDTVMVHYTGRLTNGEEFDSSQGKDPLKFTLGSFQVIEGFEKAVLGRKIGDKVTVDIPSDKAYGEIREDLNQEVPIDQLPEGVKLNDQLQAMTENGPISVRVTELNDEFGVIDANHRLAGEDLTFDIEIVSIN